MIYERKYVKALIKKNVLRTLSPREWAEYQASRRIYTDEEFDEMIAETLLEMGDELPRSPLKSRKPDFEVMYPDSGPAAGHKKWRSYTLITAAAVFVCALIGIGIYLYYSLQQKEIPLYSACVDLPMDTEVPLTESTVTLRWKDEEPMHISGVQHGEILDHAHISLTRTKEGVFKLRTPRGTAKAKDSENNDWITITTGAREQAMIELPDSTLIRLNAQSALRYSPTATETTQVVIYGEAYVQRSKKPTSSPLVIGTKNGFVKSFDSDFVLLAQDNFMRAVVIDGTKLSLHALTREDELILDGRGAQGSVTRFIHLKNRTEKDSLRNEGIADTQFTLLWTKAIRSYKDVPLREFVAQMSQWYGFKVENYNCIPANRRITTTVCYKQETEDIYAGIQQAGVLLYERNGMISFCQEKKTKSSQIGKGAIAWKD